MPTLPNDTEPINPRDPASSAAAGVRTGAHAEALRQRLPPQPEYAQAVTPEVTPEALRPRPRRSHPPRPPARHPQMQKRPEPPRAARYLEERLRKQQGHARRPCRDPLPTIPESPWTPSPAPTSSKRSRRIRRAPSAKPSSTRWVTARCSSTSDRNIRPLTASCGSFEALRRAGRGCGPGHRLLAPGRREDLRELGTTTTSSTRSTLSNT